MIWPFTKKPPIPVLAPTTSISFSQLDTTERFGDNTSLAQDQWIPTIALNSLIPEPEKNGLPAPGATAEEIFEVASRLSRLRESIDIPNDGVYCAICHVANIDLGKLRTPCPKCGRKLLKFGWT